MVKEKKVAYLYGYEVEEVGSYDAGTGKVHFYLVGGRDVWAPYGDVEWAEEK